MLTERGPKSLSRRKFLGAGVICTVVGGAGATGLRAAVDGMHDRGHTTRSEKLQASVNSEMEEALRRYDRFGMYPIASSEIFTEDRPDIPFYVFQLPHAANTIQQVVGGPVGNRTLYIEYYDPTLPEDLRNYVTFGGNRNSDMYRFKMRRNGDGPRQGIDFGFTMNGMPYQHRIAEIDLVDMNSHAANAEGGFAPVEQPLKDVFFGPGALARCLVEVRDEKGTQLGNVTMTGLELPVQGTDKTMLFTSYASLPNHEGHGLLVPARGDEKLIVPGTSDGDFITMCRSSSLFGPEAFDAAQFRQTGTNTWEKSNGPATRWGFTVEPGFEEAVATRFQQPDALFSAEVTVDSSGQTRELRPHIGFNDGEQYSLTDVHYILLD